MRFATLAVCLIGLVGSAPSALLAAPFGQLFAGAEHSTGTTYVYFGHVAPLPGSTLGNGFIHRIWLDSSNYGYDKNNQSFDVRAPGAEWALGYQQAGDGNWWGALVGLAYRHTGITPDDLTSNVRGGMVRPKFQIEGQQTVAQQWTVAASASYITGQRAHWVRGRVLHETGSGGQFGLEAITQGDPNYRAHQIGLVSLGWKLGADVNAGFKLGARRLQGRKAQAYFGIELGSTY